MKISDFDFRIVRPKNSVGNWCRRGKAECRHNTPFIYGEEAFKKLPQALEKNAEIELWSGLTDSEGVKIYEGDILKDELGRKWVIKFKEGGFIAHRDAYSKRGSLTESYTLGMLMCMIVPKVIGNTHENADLIQGEEE